MKVHADRMLISETRLTIVCAERQDRRDYNHSSNNKSSGSYRVVLVVSFLDQR